MKPNSDPIRFLFWDHRLLESLTGAVPVAPPARKVSPVPLIVPELPHEMKSLHLYGSVLHDPDRGKFRLWASSHGFREGIKSSYLSLFESEDGLRWERPQLDLVSGTNIVLDRDRLVHGPSVILDQTEPDPSRRYKLLMKPSPRIGFEGLAAYTSPDGIHWQPVGEGTVLSVRSDCHIGLARHPKSGIYQATVRSATSRRIWLIESPDFFRWSDPRLVFEPDDEDPPYLEFYSMPIWHLGPFTMGLVSNFHAQLEERSVRKMYGTMDVSLAFSREDASCWHWLKRGARLIPRGDQGSWDCGCVIPASAPVVVDNQLRFYYSGFPGGHGDGYDKRGVEAIGCATLPLNRLRGLRATQPASLLTRPFAYAPWEVQAHDRPGLFVDADLPPSASLRIALTDETGSPLPGFGFENCLPITGDNLDSPVQWQSPPQWETLAAKPLRIAASWSQGTLYALGLHHDLTSPNFREIPAIKPPDWDLLLAPQP